MNSRHLTTCLLLGLALAAGQAEAAQPPAVQQDGSAGYDTSVRELMRSADALRDSIHALARQPAGPERNAAIREANRALLDVQAAMANAYDVTAMRHQPTTLAINTMHCDMLAGVRVCH